MVTITAQTSVVTTVSVAQRYSRSQVEGDGFDSRKRNHKFSTIVSTVHPQNLEMPCLRWYKEKSSLQKSLTFVFQYFLI